MVLPATDYFDHEADIGVIGRGSTLTEAFVHAAQSTFAIMADLTAVKPVQAIKIRFEESDCEIALVTWLNLLIANARAEGLMLSKFTLQCEHDHWQGEAWGEPWSNEFVHGTEVKGATLTQLAVVEKNGYWEAKCVVDV